eukprot:scaffold68483_cov65-Phaeocystis_antarctica.AAC.3
MAHAWAIRGGGGETVLFRAGSRPHSILSMRAAGAFLSGPEAAALSSWVCASSAVGGAERADRAVFGRREASGAAEGACHARQGSGGTDPAVGASVANVARRAAAVLLEGAGLALAAQARARLGRHCAGAARCLLGAASRRVVASVGGRAAVGANERRAGALGAVGACLAWRTCLLAFTLLEGAGCALDADTLAAEGLDGAWAALGLLGAARWREVALVRRRALVGAGEAGCVRIRARRAGQRRRSTLGAIRAGRARIA